MRRESTVTPESAAEDRRVLVDYEALSAACHRASERAPRPGPKFWLVADEEPIEDSVWDDWRDAFHSPEGLRTGRTIRQEEQRAAEVMAAVREGLRRFGFVQGLSIADIARRVDRREPGYGDCWRMLRAFVRTAWREANP
jgi:hypothetical protein